MEQSVDQLVQAAQDAELEFQRRKVEHDSALATGEKLLDAEYADMLTRYQSYLERRQKLIEAVQKQFPDLAELEAKVNQAEETLKAAVIEQVYADGKKTRTIRNWRLQVQMRSALKVRDLGAVALYLNEKGKIDDLMSVSRTFNTYAKNELKEGRVVPGVEFEESPTVVIQKG